MPPGAFAMEVKDYSDDTDQFRMMKDSLLEKIVFSRNLYFFNGRLGLLGFEFSELLGYTRRVVV